MRRPQATTLRLLRGNPGKRPFNKKEPLPVGALSTPPEWMTDSQKAGWSHVIDHAPNGLLKQLDLNILAVWVVAEDQHRIAAISQATRDSLGADDPLMHTTAIGNVVPSPYLGIMNRAAALLIKAGSELGFTPSSRTRIQVAPRDADPDAAELFGD